MSFSFFSKAQPPVTSYQIPEAGFAAAMIDSLYLNTFSYKHHKERAQFIKKTLAQCKTIEQINTLLKVQGVRIAGEHFRGEEELLKGLMADDEFNRWCKNSAKNTRNIDNRGPGRLATTLKFIELFTGPNEANTGLSYLDKISNALKKYDSDITIPTGYRYLISNQCLSNALTAYWNTLPPEITAPLRLQSLTNRSL